MVYSSYVFIFLFLPIVLGGYFALQNLKSELYQRLFLIVASLVFYGYNNIKYVPLIVLSIIINYIIAVLIQVLSTKRALFWRILLIIGILFNILLLGYYKYYNFFIENINALFGIDFALKNIFLPLGISFFTFQQLSFLLSVYKGEEKVGTFYNYCAFVTFFPQLVAGPIVLYSEIIPQFEDSRTRRFNAENFVCGLFMFAIGLFKKVVIADTVSLYVDNGFNMADPGAVAAWVTSLCYTLQIYFDFSGYSDMAVGLGKMFNINITHNFQSPYLSKSITEFWRRWHITLGRALSTYIYIPLGGNRKGIVRTCINLFLTFLVSGLWHGASWTFVLWGTLHGLFVVSERLLKNILSRIPTYIRTAFTFIIVNFLWVLFRAESFSQAAKIYKGMFNFSKFDIGSLDTIALDGIINFPAIIDIVAVLGTMLVLLFVVFKCKNSTKMMENFSLNMSSSVITAMGFVISLLFISRGSVFIYFNF